MSFSDPLPAYGTLLMEATGLVRWADVEGDKRLQQEFRCRPHTTVWRDVPTVELEPKEQTMPDRAAVESQIREIVDNSGLGGVEACEMLNKLATEQTSARDKFVPPQEPNQVTGSRDGNLAKAREEDGTDVKVDRDKEQQQTSSKSKRQE